jgi:O-antigen ligase
MCVQAAVAIEQSALQAVFPSTWLGLAKHLPADLGTSVVEANGVRFLRAYGTFPHPNILGGALALALLIARPLFQKLSRYSILTYTILSVGLFLTFSRLAWIAFAVGLIVHLIVERKDRLTRVHAGVAAAALIILAIVFSSLVLQRVTATGRLEDKSVSARIQSLKDAQALYVRHPLIGVGLGNFTLAINEELDSTRNGYLLEPAHSAPLVALVELGLFGFGAFVLLLFYCFKDAYRAGEVGVASALTILALGDHWVWTTLGGILIFWAVWGIALRKS